MNRQVAAIHKDHEEHEEEIECSCFVTFVAFVLFVDVASATWRLGGNSCRSFE
jgi:hypothetical protein